MNVLTKAVWSVAKLGLLAGAIVFASVGIGIGQENQPASASHTQVLLSYSDLSPIHAPSIVVNPDGLPRDVYAWAVNVDNATGISAYHLEVGFDSSVFTAAGGSVQVDIIDGLVDVDESGTIDAADDLANALPQLAAGGSVQVDIIDGLVDVDESGTIDAADDLAGVLLRPIGSPDTVDIIDGNVDVDQSGAIDAADDLADALLLTPFKAPLPLWLGTSGRSASCPSPTVETNRAYLDCITVGGVPPLGVTGTGLIGKLTIQPASVPGSSALDLTGTQLINTPFNPDDIAFVPITLLSSAVVYVGCADVNGDGTVDLINDILGIIDRFLWTPSSPGWDPAYDINNDGIVDLINDILGAVIQFNLPCTQTP